MRPGDLQVYTTLWMNLTNNVERNKTLEYILEDSIPIKAKFIYGVITHKSGSLWGNVVTSGGTGAVLVWFLALGSD